ncbi:putative receptor-like protein kinase At1g80870 [Phoenix dactylifera]|uniref:Receptor-like protein kinase At1g80870 n=1 Tax=Phoenix dactylifera TaxID=42345 RepID=A0A8B7MYC7_PHODC|nr:putative receptor-like protein kinase At1g80870 [Phoenix dactylifera]
MPSRPLTPPPPPSPAHRRHHAPFLAVVVSTSSALLLAVLSLLLLLLFYLYRSLRHARARDRTLPLDSPAASSLRRFSFRDLRSATASFDPSRSLGRGASAEVFRGLLPDGKSVAVKRLDIPSSSSPSSSPPFSSSDREFHNELHVLAALPPSPFVVSLLGYCLDSPRRRLLVYEYMPNGSLQETLFSSSDHHHHRHLVLNWDRRFGIILDVAQALAFLHLECDPPVIHGDIKPGNILLAADFRAKISDFGLSRIKTEADLAAGPGAELFSQELFSGSPQVDFALALRASSSNSCKNLNPMQLVSGNPNTISSPKGKEAAATTAAASSCHDDLCSIEHSKELSGNSPLDDGKTEAANGQWGRDWWWKQDGSGELSSRDYVREWIGSQICPSTNPDWDDARKNSPENPFDSRNSSQVERLEGGDDTLFRKPEEKHKKAIDGRAKRNRKMREWWKEEYFAEISKKSHTKKAPKWFRSISSRGEVSRSNSNNGVGKRGRESSTEIGLRKGWKKKRSRSMGSDMFSGDLFSRELSSTTSMRGTVCYVAPEYGGCGHLMEKADIYSFGVLILVIVSGRRPLHVLSSPMKLEKANLISWCRQLAQTGNILELVDEKLKDSYNKEQANLCVNLALLCLQRMPESRPDSGDIVKILKGEMELPVLPFECSPSPPAKLLSRSRRKTAPDAE